MRLSRFTLPLLLTGVYGAIAIASPNAKEGAVGVAASSDKSIPNAAAPKVDGRLNVNKLAPEDNHSSSSVIDQKEGEGESDHTNYNSFIMSISMIVVSEIGDKTFLIAALMAMRHSRYVVFSSAFASLAVMTVLSGLVGHALPSFLSRRLTQYLAAALFIVFGWKLLYEGLGMSKQLGVEDELAEVEEEIASSAHNNQLDGLESGLANTTKPKQVWYVEAGAQIQNLASFVLSPIWIQVFVMTFLGEWGDRSQIATIAMAAGSEYWFVILGAIVGHFICTLAACIGGKLLAKKISMRNVTLGGSFAFFVFALLYFYSAYYDLE